MAMLKPLIKFSTLSATQGSIALVVIVTRWFLLVKACLHNHYFLSRSLLDVSAYLFSNTTCQFSWHIPSVEHQMDAQLAIGNGDFDFASFDAIVVGTGDQAPRNAVGVYDLRPLTPVEPMVLPLVNPDRILSQVSLNPI
jgi:hypothetical protein